MIVCFFQIASFELSIASNPIISSPTVVIAMSPNRLASGQTPTSPTSFVEELEIVGFISTWRSVDAEKDLEWLESWNPSKVLPVDNGARVIEAGCKSSLTVDLQPTSRC